MFVQTDAVTGGWFGLCVRCGISYWISFVVLAPERVRLDAVLEWNLASPYLIITGLNFVEPRHIAAGWETEVNFVYIVRNDGRELGINFIN